MVNYFNGVLNSSPGMLQENGRVVRESILMGPNGAVKVRSIWEGAKLITFELYGAGDRFTHGGN